MAARVLALVTGVAIASSAFAQHHDAPASPPKKPAAKASGKAEAPAESPLQVIQQSQSAAAQPVPAAMVGDRPDADGALRLLAEGNARWTAGSPSSPNTDAGRRAAANGGQAPFAAVLTCADSRVPLERVFDRGVGDLFAIRVAGNIAGVSETGTIEYAVEHLRVPVLVVMGHTRCGAVAAAASGAEVHGAVASLVGYIQPAVERARRNNPGLDTDALAAVAVKENVWQSVYDLLKRSDPVREMVATGELAIVGAVYDIGTGKVDWLGEHPWQAELLDALDARAQSSAATHVEAGSAVPESGHD